MCLSTILPLIFAILTQFSSNLTIHQFELNPLTIIKYNTSTGVSETTDTNINSNSSYKKAKWKGTRKANLTETSKGLNTKLPGNIFTKGPTQTSIYDNIFKVNLAYIGIKYDQRVYTSFEYKDKQEGIFFSPNLRHP